jgi:hypothetical protein
VPTHPHAFELVAKALNGGADGVALFYEDALAKWPERAREMIFDFLVACPDVPSTKELESLVSAVGTVDAPREPTSDVLELDAVRARRAGWMTTHATSSRASRPKHATRAKAPARIKAAATRTTAKTGITKRVATKAPITRVAAGKTVGKFAKSPRNPSGRPKAASPGAKGKPKGSKPRSPAR